MVKLDLTILVIGLGSMGKRRIRNLMALRHKKKFGFDISSTRRNEAVKKYAIQTFASFEEAVNQTQANAFIISVPPDMHHVYMKYAVEHNIGCFLNAICRRVPFVNSLENDHKILELLYAIERSYDQKKIVAFPA